MLDPSLCVYSIGGSCTLQLLDPSLCVQCWRELHSYIYRCWIHHCVYSCGGSCLVPHSCWIHHCVCSVGESCTPSVAGSISVCTVLEGAALLHIQLLDPPLSSRGRCTATVAGSITVCVQYWRELYPAVAGSITVCTVLEGAVPHSCWIHHCVYSVGGSCTPQLLDPSLCVQYSRELHSYIYRCWIHHCVYSCGGSCLVPHSFWIHHCVYSIGGSCTPTYTVAGSTTE